MICTTAVLAGVTGSVVLNHITVPSSGCRESCCRNSFTSGHQLLRCWAPGRVCERVKERKLQRLLAAVRLVALHAWGRKLSKARCIICFTHKRSSSGGKHNNLIVWAKSYRQSQIRATSLELINQIKSYVCKDSSPGSDPNLSVDFMLSPCRPGFPLVLQRPLTLQKVTHLGTYLGKLAIEVSVSLSGAAVSQLVEQSSLDQKVPGWISGFCWCP